MNRREFFASFGALSFTVAALIAQEPSKSKTVDQCGFGGNIHDCRCETRVAAIRRAIVDECTKGNKSDAEIDACVRNDLATINEYDFDSGSKFPFYCRVAERSTRFDQGTTDGGEGDHVTSNMGPYCARACQPHPVPLLGKFLRFPMSHSERKDFDAYPWINRFNSSPPQITANPTLTAYRSAATCGTSSSCSAE